MSLDTNAILNAIISHALATGLFEHVNAHEPKAAPGNGLTAAVWAQSLEPAAQRSGLDATTVRAVFNVRLYSNMVQEPQDAIDPNMVNACDVLMAAYSGDFSLGGLVRSIDLLGSQGTGLSVQAGYLNQDNRIYRVMTITLPMVVNDVWEQEA